MRPKPDGSVRLNVDMSYPHDEERVCLGQGILTSVSMQDKMTSLSEWTGVLQRVGCSADSMKMTGSLRTSTSERWMWIITCRCWSRGKVLHQNEASFK